MYRIITVIFLLSICTMFPTDASADWIENGIHVNAFTGGAYKQKILPDGEGGAYIVWCDDRNGNLDIFAQRVDAYGNALWESSGITVCSMPYNQAFPDAALDSENGIIVVWTDGRSGAFNDIYSQKVDSDGNLLLLASGVSVCTATGHQGDSYVISAGSGGFIVCWIDGRASSWDLYAQKVTSIGLKQWGTHGAAICVQPNTQGGQEIVSDGEGGAVIAWRDQRDTNDHDIYMQWINSAGIVQNTVDGVAICSATDNQREVEMILDGTGAAICTWEDIRGGGTSDIYAVRFEFDGTVLWTADGVPVCVQISTQGDPDLISDGAGGVILAWEDYRNSNYDIYIQKLDVFGNPAWLSGGIPVLQLPGNQYVPVLVADEAGGAVIAWYDYRTGIDYDVYAQRVDSGGNQLWDPQGVAVATGTGVQWKPEICSDGAGGAVIAWQDIRDGVNELLYAQRVERNGWWGYPAPAIDLVRDVPGDQGGLIDVAWRASRIDDWPYLAIDSYSVWKSIDQQAAAMLIEEGARLIDSPAEIIDPEESAYLTSDESVPTGIDLIRSEILDGVSYYWHYVATLPANGYETYSYISSAEFDSTAINQDYHYFQICAHGVDHSESWTSPPDSGRSVDNLAPAAPLNLSAEQSFTPEGLSLLWDPNLESDLAGYNVYRGLGNQFPTDPENLIAFTTDAVVFDNEWDWEIFYYYKIKAIDIHGNESLWTMTGPNEITGDDPAPLPDAAFLAQNFPNPFNPATTIAFGLKEKGHVSLKIFDASGRLIRTLVEETRTVGKYETVWNGLDDTGVKISSGVYFYRLTTNEFEKTRKMILLR